MAKSAGIVTKVSGESYAISGENTTPLAVGSSFSSADILVTKVNANLEVKFHDDSLVSLGPSSRIEVKEFIFDAEQAPSFLLNMFEGVVRSVSGKVVEQNPEAFKLHSPLANIGIRGTETLHIISPKYEIHSVVNLGVGHTVVINTPDGRAVIIGDSLLAVKLALGDLTPLQLINANPELLNEYIQQLYLEGVLHTNPQGVFVFADSSFLNSLASVNITDSVGFLAIEQLDSLLSVLEGENSVAAELVSELFTGDTGDTLLISSLDPINANQIIPEHINPSPIIPDPIVPPPPPPPVVRPLGQNINMVNLSTSFYGDNTAGNIATNAANDTITITGTMSGVGTVLFGDVGGDISGAGVLGGDDSININAVVSATIYGDAMNIDNSAIGGNDSIDIGTTSGEVYGDASTISSGAIGGNDIITIGNTTGVTAFVYGDAHTMNTGTQAGADSITLIGSFSGSLFGDANSFGTGNVAGNDTITINTVSTSSDWIYGDALIMTGTGTTTTGGNDLINITTLNGGVIGDAGTMNSGTAGGNDNINITHMSTGSTVVGDGWALLTGSSAGSDLINITNMSNGTILGDAFGLDPGIAGAADTINITTMTGGAIYGDAQTVVGTATGGNDVITIGSMTAGTIYGNSGDDTITISNVLAGGTIDLYGGSSATAIDGNDIFKFRGIAASSTVTIKDFGQTPLTDFDKLDFRGFGGMVTYAQPIPGGDYHISATIGGTGTLTVVLEGITSFNPGHFVV